MPAIAQEIRFSSRLLDSPLWQAYFTPAHHELRDAAREYFTPQNLSGWIEEPGGSIRKEQWLDFGEQGFLGLTLPPELGGRGLGFLGALILNEAMAGLGDLGLTLGMHCQNEITSFWLATAQDESLRRRFLPEMIAGRMVGCACDTEPKGGSVAVTAERDGDELVVNGRKIYVVNGKNADLCFVTALLDGEMVTVLVEKERPGVFVRHVFDKLGTRSIDSALIELDAVRVPISHLAQKRGVRQLMHWNKVMTGARFLMCADATFTHGLLLEQIIEYGNDRRIDGRPLLSWPINRHVLARAAADRSLMEAGLLDRFRRLEKGRSAVAEVAALKWFCVERASRFAAFCAELQGGAGYMNDSEFLRAYAQLRGLKMAGGSSTTMQAIAHQSYAYQEEIDALD